MNWYRIGTISGNNGSNLVTGIGTDFIGGAAVGEAVQMPDGKPYEIQSIVAASGVGAIVLASPYLGANFTAQAYAIIPTQSYIRDLAAQAASLVNGFAATRDGAGAGRFPDGIQTVPGIRFVADDNTGIRRIGADNVGLVVAGVDQATLDTTGFIARVLQLWNAAGTFKNAFANATTAIRTWTFPDKSGTVAMTSDITGGTAAGSFTTLSASGDITNASRTDVRSDYTAASASNAFKTYSVSETTWPHYLDIVSYGHPDGVNFASYIRFLVNSAAAGSAATPIAILSSTGLAVTGGVDVVGSSSTTRTYFQNGATAVGYTGVASGYGLPSTTDFLIAGYSNNIIFANASVERMRLDTAGNLGLGVTPSAKLHIGNPTSDGTTFTDIAIGNLVNPSAWAIQCHDYVSTGYWHHDLIFKTNQSGVNSSAVMTLSATGDFSVGPYSGGYHCISKVVTADAGNTVLYVLGAEGQSVAQFCGVNGGTSGSTANTAVKVNKDSVTSRSINTGGTINASGADYAEYEKNNGLTIVKGSIVGFKADGTLTTTFVEAVRFAVKSTNPSYVGGDTWGSEDQVGKRPEEPTRIADKTERREVTPAIPAVVAIEGKAAVVASPAEYATVLTPEVVLIDGAETTIEHSSLVETKAAVLAQQTVEAVAAIEAVEATFETVILEAGDTDAQWATKQADYTAAKTAFEATLEAARQLVDRIAYSGKAPCNVMGAVPGGYIIAVAAPDGSIDGLPVACPSFEQYLKAVGRVNKIIDDAHAQHLAKQINVTDWQQFVGRCEVAVIIH